MKRFTNKKYLETKIPDELSRRIDSAVNYGLITGKKRYSYVKKALASAAVFFIITVTLVNTNSSFASAMYEIPVIGTISRIFTFKEYVAKDQTRYIDVKIPHIDNTGKTELEKRVNLEISRMINKEIEDNEQRAQEYYDAFIATGGNPN